MSNVPAHPFFVTGCFALRKSTSLGSPASAAYTISYGQGPTGCWPLQCDLCSYCFLFSPGMDYPGIAFILSHLFSLLNPVCNIYADSNLWMLYLFKWQCHHPLTSPFKGKSSQQTDPSGNLFCSSFTFPGQSHVVWWTTDLPYTQVLVMNLSA